MVKQLSLMLSALVFSVAALARDNHFVLGVDGLAWMGAREVSWLKVGW